MKKYQNEIELCWFLTKYLTNLSQETDKENGGNQQMNIEENISVIDKIAGDSQWKKEKGVEVLKSKKSKEDETPLKKSKKHKKRREEKKE